MNIFELFIVQPIFNILLAIYSYVPYADFGIAVIIFTIILRFAMWPLVVRQLHQTKAMRKLQPELARIKKASKGNRQLESMQMLELYKKHEVKPFRSILMLLIQLPIFIALYHVIQIFTQHRDEIESFTYGFMKHLEPVKELIANPDSFNRLFLGFVDITKGAFSEGNIWATLFLLGLAVLAAYTQYFTAKQTAPQAPNKKRLRDVLAEAGEGKQPDQAELNAVMMGKMMKFLPIMMFFIMVSLPGAIALYYATSNGFASLQQLFLLKRDAKEMDEIADEAAKKSGKKATAKARAKQAREAQTIAPAKAVKKASKQSSDDAGVKITRISATDTRTKKEK